MFLADEIVVLGIVASIIFYELTEISPGGIIVPGYIALFLDNPKRILMTVTVSITAYFAVKLLSNFTILYGKRKFALFIIMSFIIRYLLGSFGEAAELAISASLVIGYLVPGIIAQEIDRQGMVKTVSSMLAVALAVKLLVILAGGISRGVL
ncbi:MAG: poly-gamma-glutamate biosynthesis protein PgsC [Pseudomonadota bacterium]